MFREKGGERKRKNTNKGDGVSVLEENSVCEYLSLGVFMPRVLSDANRADEGRRMI